MSARVFRRSISIALRSISATFLLIGAAFAAESVTADPVDFQIIGQPLDSALNEFARQSDREIFYASDVVDGVYVNGVDGKYEPEDALELLLADSGLEYSVTASDTFLVSDHGGDSDSKNSSPAPILMAQNTSSQAQTTVSSRSEQGGTSVVTGRVTDARTGTNLRGAKVAIEETGQWTSTGDLGQFRFTNVPQGSVTLTVSNLGYASQSAVVSVGESSATQDFALRGGTEIDEIVVFGQRSARAIALNQQRTAQNNSTVISSDDLGQFSSANLPDALRRVPGVSFTRDSTGAPDDISVRGLVGDLNSVQINGIAAAGDGLDRSADLTNVLTDSIESVTVNKSLLPRHESRGTGGLIEIETKTPLDRPTRFVQFGYERADGVSDSLSLDYLTGTLSGRFLADESLGFSVSAQYQESDRAGSSISTGAILGKYLPAGIGSISEIDPRIPFPFVGGSDELVFNSFSNTFSAIEDEVLNVTLSGAYQPHQSTTIRADYTYVDSDSVSSRSNARFAPFVRFSERPVVELGDELRRAAVYGNFFTATRQLAIAPEERSSQALSVRSKTVLDRVEFDLTAGISQAEQNRNGGFNANFRHSNRRPDVSLFASNATDSIEGIVLSPLSSINGGPLLTQAGFEEYSDGSLIDFRGGDFTTLESDDERRHFEANIKYSPALPLVRYLGVGIDVEDVDIRDFNDRRSISGTVSLAETGVSTGEDALASVESAGRITTSSPNQAAVLRDFVLANAEDNGILAVSDFLGDPLARDTYTQELNVDYYFEAGLEWRDFELVGGVRVASTNVDAKVRTDPQIFDEDFQNIAEAEERLRELVVLDGKQTDVLPRVVLNYRPSNNVVFRAAYHRSVARPSLFLQSATRNVILVNAERYGENGDKKRAIFDLPNPDLQPAVTDNFDASIEYYFENSGVVKFGLFYKEIENLQETIRIESADISEVDIPDDPVFADLLANPGDYLIEINIPKNNPSISNVWGAEFEYEQQFTNLPGALAGLGFFGNVVYVDSEKDEIAAFNGEEIVIPDVRFFGQPSYSGALGLTYNYSNIDASASYSFQDDVFRNRLDYGANQYVQSFETLDIRFEYFLDRQVGQFRLFLEGSDLLRDSDDATSVIFRGGENGVPQIPVSQSFFGGRTLRLGFLATF